MHKKSFRLFIATLLLFLTTLLISCGDSSINASAANTKSSRFFSEETEVSGDACYHFDYSYIITDNETGQQWLYLYHDDGYDGGPVMVELGTTGTPSNVEE